MTPCEGFDCSFSIYRVHRCSAAAPAPSPGDNDIMYLTPCLLFQDNQRTTVHLRPLALRNPQLPNLYSFLRHQIPISRSVKTATRSRIRQYWEQTFFESYLFSPITEEKVPAHGFDEHMKISLLDPKWKEQRDRYEAEKKQQQSVFSLGK